VPPDGEVVGAPAVTDGQIVFCVRSDDLKSGRNDVRAAAGLGHALAERGLRVAIVDRERWSRLPAAALVVSLSPGFDPAGVPRGTPVIAWICDQIDAWSELGQLSLYDAVLTSSRGAADRLEEAFGPPVGVLPIGVDTGLFRPNPARRASDIVVSLDEVDKSSYFTLPDLYRKALVVVDRVNSAGLPFGMPISRILESLACGAIPVTTHEPELAELGLREVPACTSELEIDRVVDELCADPLSTMATAERLGAMVRAEHSWERRASAFLTQMEPLLAKTSDPQSAARRATLGFFPDYRQGNPYQTMLYADLPAHDVAVVPVDVRNVMVPRDPGGRLDHYLLHLHWTSPLLQSQPGPFGAELALRRFRHRVSEFRGRGGRLVWTIHNVLPHECPNRAAEIQLCRFLAAQADLIHVMGANTQRIVAPLYELATDRTVVIPHASYVGVYPDVVSREEARRHLRLREHEIVLLMLGAIRPYKGLSLLLDVFDELTRSDSRLRLLLVGRPSHDPAMAGWRDRCEKHPRVVAHFARTPESDVQIWYRAADLAVLPYVSALNSGSFQLALSFDLPVVGARDGEMADLLDPAYSEAFTPGSAADLRRALETAVGRLVGRPEARRAAHTAAREYPPSAMAHDFADAVVPLFGGSSEPSNAASSPAREATVAEVTDVS
jgi:glycosyltransferase involved in cell wall biosynthesis